MAKRGPGRTSRSRYSVPFGSEYDFVPLDDPPEDTNLSLAEMRSFFLQRVCELLPEVADQLEKTPFERFRDIHDVLCEENEVVERSSWLFEIQRKTTGVLHLSVGDRREIVMFRRALREWSEEHNLESEWCRESAWRTLHLWYHSNVARRTREWYWPLVKGIPIGFYKRLPHKFDFTYNISRPEQLVASDDSVKHEIKTAFEQELRQFLDSRRQQLQQAGFKVSSARFYRHFDWLILHQVAKPPQTYAQLFESYQREATQGDLPVLTERTAIEKAVQRLARDLGLTLKRYPRRKSSI